MIHKLNKKVVSVLKSSEDDKAQLPYTLKKNNEALKKEMQKFINEAADRYKATINET